MKNEARRYRVNGRNGRKPNRAGAVKVVRAALAYKRSHPSPLDGLTDAEIMARIKKTRYELFEERFAPRT